MLCLSLCTVASLSMAAGCLTPASSSGDSSPASTDSSIVSGSDSSESSSDSSVDGSDSSESSSDSSVDGSDSADSSDSSVSGSDSSESSSDSSSAAAVEKTYTFTVKDNANKAVLGAKIVVKQNGETVKELLTDSTGSVTAKLYVGSVVTLGDLPLGYSCGGEITLGKLVTDIDFKLTKDYIEPLSGKGESYNIYELALPVANKVEANEATFMVDIKEANQEIFFAFDPSRVGTYKITSLGNLDAKLLGYAVSTAGCYRLEDKDSDDVSETDKNFVHMFEVQGTYLWTYEDDNLDGEFTEDEKRENTEHRYTFALTLNGEATGKYLFKIEYVSETLLTPEIEYVTETKRPTVAVSHFTAPADKTLVAAPYHYYDNLVFNATDNAYHVDSENGPIAVVKLKGAQERLLGGATLESVVMQDPTVFLFTTSVEKNDMGYITRVIKTDYADMVLNTYALFTDANGMYPLTKDLYDFLYRYIVVAHNNVNIKLPNDLDTSVKVENWDPLCMAPIYLYCAENEIPESEVIFTPDGSYEKPYTIAEMGTYSYSLQGFDGATGFPEHAWHKLVASKDGDLKITAQNASSNITITNKTTNETVYIKVKLNGTTGSYEFVDGDAAILAVSQGDEIYFEVNHVSEEYQTVQFVIAINKPVTGENGSADAPFTIDGVGTYEVTVEDFYGMFYSSKWFKFTVTETGTYKFYSEEHVDGSYSIYATPDVSSEQIAHSLDSQFRGQPYKYVEAELTAGTTYYIYVGSVSEESPRLDTLTFDFKVEKVS